MARKKTKASSTSYSIDKSSKYVIIIIISVCYVRVVHLMSIFVSTNYNDDEREEGKNIIGMKRLKG